MFWMAAGVLLVVFAISGGLALKWQNAAHRTPAPFSDFLTGAKEGTIAAVVIEGDTLNYEGRDGSKFESVAPQGYVAGNPTFLASLVERGIRFLEIARRAKMPIVIVNRGTTKGDSRAGIKIDGGTSEVLRALAERLPSR